ncbi:MAG TPA: hypothetical protein DCX06_06890, partial [Opitutae bacterium]|nr:hypothetical protein [Opitutae bacterium]
MNSIKVMLCGGMGNQLFQYASGRALALEQDCRLVLDASTLFLKDQKYRRSYELDLFNLPSEIGVAKTIVPLFNLKLRSACLFEKYFGRRSARIIIEGDSSRFDYEDKLTNLQSHVYLYGYWQSVNYFKRHADQIRDDLTAKIQVPDILQAECVDLSSADSVAVHVRRQQYAQQLPIAYYRSAIATMRQRLKRPRFYIFTDDPEWCRQADLMADYVIIQS